MAKQSYIYEPERYSFPSLSAKEALQMFEAPGHLAQFKILQLSEHFDDTVTDERPLRGEDFTQAYTAKARSDLRWKASREYCKDNNIQDYKDYYKWYKCRRKAALQSRSPAMQAYCTPAPSTPDDSASDDETDIVLGALQLGFLDECNHHKVSGSVWPCQARVYDRQQYHPETALSRKKNLSSKDRSKRLLEERRYRSYMIATAMQRPLHQLATGEYSFDDHDYNQRFSKRFSKQTPDSNRYVLNLPDHRKDGDVFYDLVYGIFMRSRIHGHEWTLSYLAAAVTHYGGTTEQTGLADFVKRFKEGRMPEGWDHEILETAIDVSIEDYLEGTCGDASLFTVYTDNLDWKPRVAGDNGDDGDAASESTTTMPVRSKAADR